jgi:hypothetical protein
MICTGLLLVRLLLFSFALTCLAHKVALAVPLERAVSRCGLNAHPLLVAATLKYADSILKTLAAAGAIVLSTVLGHFFLNGPLNMIVAIGGMATIIAIARFLGE